MPLNFYLLLAARRNMQDLLDREKRHRRREELAIKTYFENLVELRPSAPNILVEDQIGSLRRIEKLDELIAAVLTDSRDRIFVDSWMGGEWRTEAFVKVLGLGHLLPNAQRRAIKRIRDRITKMLQRAAKKLGWRKPA